MMLGANGRHANKCQELHAPGKQPGRRMLYEIERDGDKQQPCCTHLTEIGNKGSTNPRRIKTPAACDYQYQ